jgi:hypothetical protein
MKVVSESGPLDLEHLGAHRRSDIFGPCEVLLVGEDNPQSAAPEHALYPWPPGSDRIEPYPGVFVAGLQLYHCHGCAKSFRA